MPGNPDKTDYSGSLPAHFHAFEIIENLRTGGNKRHHFGEVLFMSISAMLCGMNGFADIEHFCELEEDWLRERIKIPDGIPRAQTFSNIFSIIDPDLSKACLTDHLGTLQPVLCDRIIALDGKRLRGSHGLKTDPVHAVSIDAMGTHTHIAGKITAKGGDYLLALKGNQDWPA